MPLIEEFLAILVRLKPGLLLDDISQHFQTSPSHFSRMFTTLLYLELKLLNPWPSQEHVAKHTPQQLMKYHNTRVIIDCTEVLIERKLVEKVRLAPLSEAVIPVRVDQGQANYRKRQRYWSSPGCQQLQPGDAVWSYNPQRRKGLTPKLQRPWQGPYTIIKRINDVVYRIKLGPTTKPKIVHRNRLWTYTGANTPTWFRATEEAANSSPPATTGTPAESAADYPTADRAPAQPRRSSRFRRPPDRYGV